MLRLLALLIVAFIASCTSKKQNRLLNTDSLAKQIFSINPITDTLIKTNKGALLHILKGTFTKPVQLEVKEAYSMKDMVLAGLTTQADGKPLRSGGMIYINTVEREEPSKPIGVSIPTDVVDENMQLYKGEEQDGEINWTEPQDLLKNPLTDSFARGKLIFERNCQSCHRLFEPSPTAPALAGLEKRGFWKDKKLLYAFTRNPAGYDDCYVDGLKRSYGYVMTGFPNLDDAALDAIYGYIENETRKAGVPIPEEPAAACFDSCRVYDSLVNSIGGYEILQRLRTNVTYEISIDAIDDSLIVNTPGDIVIDTTPTLQQPRLVIPNNNTSKYYQFNINTLGWYNVDYLLKENENFREVELIVNYNNNDSEIDLFLALPSLPVIVKGGKLETASSDYGFYTPDGTIPLPIGIDAYVFAIAKSGDSILFGFSKFKTTFSQKVLLNLMPVTKEGLTDTIKSWKFENFNLEIQDSELVKRIKETRKNVNKMINLLDSLKPKNCNCSCVGEGYYLADTVSKSR